MGAGQNRMKQEIETVLLTKRDEESAMKNISRLLNEGFVLLTVLMPARNTRELWFVRDLE
jgi:hypothetical protein